MQAVEQPIADYSGEQSLRAEDAQAYPSHSRQSSTRACAMCVKAKAKCMPYSELESVCQRCHRLKKQCFLRDRPSRKRTRTSQPTRVAQLEQRLDGLVNLLTSNQHLSQIDSLSEVSGVLLPKSPVSLNSNASTAGPSTTTTPSSNPDGELTGMRESESAFVRPDQVPAATAEKPPVTRRIPLLLEPNGQESEILLREFTTNMADQFPFVVIHSDTTSLNLYHESPLLWKAIMVAASHGNSNRQMALGADLVEDMTTRLLLKNEKSLDLLKALLVYLAWYHYHALVNPQITNLVHLAKALISDLGLNRSKRIHDHGKFFLDGHDLTRPRSHGSDSDRFDEWRALAGCFYLTIMISASFRNMETQFNTSYILECCHKLGEAREYQSDILLQQLVGLQEIRYRMGRGFPYEECHGCRGPDAPVDMFVRVWKKELETFWDSLPVESLHNKLLLGTYHTTEIAMYEIYMGDCPMCLPRAPVKDVDRTGRLEFIYASLLTTRKAFDVYTSIPIESLPGTCFTIWAHYHHAILNAVKLLRSEVDGWDLQHARKVLAFPEVLHSLVKAIEQVIARRGLVLETAVGGKDSFVQFLTKAQNVLRWFESSRLSRIEPQGPTDQLANRSGSLEATEHGESLPEFDDNFWQNLLDDNWMLLGDGFST